MENDIVLRYNNGEISSNEITSSQLLEILNDNETYEVGLKIIGAGYMSAVREELNKRMDKYNLVDSHTSKIVEQYKDIIWINKNTMEIEMSKAGVTKLFTQELNKMVYFEGGKFTFNLPNIILNTFNVKKNIKKISINKKINDKIKYIEWVYLDDKSSELQLSKSIEAGLEEINKQIKSGKLLRLIARREPKKLYGMLCASFSQMAQVFDKLQNDLEELKELERSAREIRD